MNCWQESKLSHTASLWQRKKKLQISPSRSVSAKVEIEQVLHVDVEHHQYQYHL